MIIKPDSQNGQFVRIDVPKPSEAAKNIMYVKQAGYFTSDRCPMYKGSREEDYFLMVIVRGKGVINVEEEHYAAEQGQCVFLDCSKTHYYLPDKDDPWEVFWVSFGGTALKYYYHKFRLKKANVFAPQNVSAVKNILEKLIENCYQQDEDFEIINAKYITDLMTALVTNYNVNLSDGQTTFKHKLYSVKSYIDSHYTEQITLNSLADKFYISKFYLTREFKKEFGSTIIQYVLKKRIDYAKELLSGTNKSVEDISEICGFNDQSYFARQFKKIESITCLTYRKNSSKNQ